MRALQLSILFTCLFLHQTGYAQKATESLLVTVINEKQEKLEGAVIELTDPQTKKLLKSAISNKNGIAVFFESLQLNQQLLSSYIGYEKGSIVIDRQIISEKKITITLKHTTKDLKEVSVTTRKPFIQQSHGKVTVNVDASASNAGTTILEVLEKSPGVMVDKNGGISLQGKPGVLILIDEKPTYLSGEDLNNFLGGISSSQVEQIELITSPSARYDAGGNAGIIHIKTKKNKQVGFNGTFNAAYTQGRYAKNNNGLLLNYRNGRINSFLSYSSNINKGYTDLYALRHYYSPAGSLVSTLDQPTLFISKNLNHTVKAGVDFYASSNTTFGLVLSGIATNRDGTSNATASWKNISGAVDSSVLTTSATRYSFRNGGINFNGKHSFGKTEDLSVDLDLLQYTIHNNQYFNSLLPAGNAEGSIGDLPSALHIFSVKADHGLQVTKDARWESGYKISAIKTDNIAAYQSFDGIQWKDDLNKSNHFLYNETIHALYSSLEEKFSRLSFQIGVRYENTHYDAHQLGNSLHADSAFSKNYAGFFPSGYLSFKADSLNSFTLTAGRRIDRPPFQKLNPFVVIINKYTYQRGNPFLLPQYSWNIELSHQYRDLLTTTLSYSIIKDYFSQLFLSEGTDILVYTDGNVGKTYNLGLSVAIQASVGKWWNISGQALYNHKELKGYQNVNYQSAISQLNLSMNNQFHIGSVYTAELSGFYTTKARNDLQELLSPTGQLSAGISRPVLHKKATLKLSVRDIFYTQAMEGNTDFPNANEYFILRRDSRVISLGFSWRFGKPLKSARRSSGSAKDEIDRVGSGG